MSTKTHIVIGIGVAIAVIIGQILYFSISRTTDIKVWVGVVLELILMVLATRYTRKGKDTINKTYLFVAFGLLMVVGIIFVLAFILLVLNGIQDAPLLMAFAGIGCLLFGIIGTVLMLFSRSNKGFLHK